MSTPGGESTWRTLRRGLALSPELHTGLAGTLALAVMAMVDRAVVPVAIQLGIDHGLRSAGEPDLGVITIVVAATGAVLILTSVCGYHMVRRLFAVSESALAAVRARMFRHVHDLSMLHQQEQRRGALVSRVTGDVDQITLFLQWSGVTLLISAGQVVVTTVVMALYSWQLTLVVFAALGPAVLVVRVYLRRLAGAYTQVRRNAADLLAMVGESVVGGTVIRAYRVHNRTAARLDRAIEVHRRSQEAALRAGVTGFSTGELAAGVALAGVVVTGVLLGVDGGISLGRLTAFLFLVTLLVQPVQTATEMLNEAQGAVASWRRVLDVLDLRPEVVDPADGGIELPAGPLAVQFRGVGYAYPGGPEVLSDVDLDIAPTARVAVVGETGGGKTTLAKLVTRLMDPTRGKVLLAGVPLPRVGLRALRSRVVMVPQDGFLFHTTVAENVRYGRPGLSEDGLLAAFAALGLGEWLAGLSRGLATSVGERGGNLSVGERQLVALVRAHVSDPDLLVLDEATSSVDPATEVRLQRAMEVVTRGRTTVMIAHRLSTARTADEVIVVDQGRIVQRGHHDELVADAGSVYARLYASWVEQSR